MSAARPTHVLRVSFAPAGLCIQMAVALMTAHVPDRAAKRVFRGLDEMKVREHHRQTGHEVLLSLG